MWWRWVALAAYTALLYGLLPYGPAIGRAVQATAIGRFGLGRGAGWIVAAGIVAVVLRLRRRAASPPAWVLAAVVALGYGLALGWLRAIRLERVHLPEYGLAAWLAWRALVPAFGARPLTYAAAAVLAALIGWGDELVQGLTPGRVYDVRDIAANALGATLGALLLAVWHAGAEPAALTAPARDAGDRDPRRDSTDVRLRRRVDQWQVARRDRLHDVLEQEPDSRAVARFKVCVVDELVQGLPASQIELDHPSQKGVLGPRDIPEPPVPALWRERRRASHDPARLVPQPAEPAPDGSRLPGEGSHPLGRRPVGGEASCRAERRVDEQGAYRWSCVSELAWTCLRSSNDPGVHDSLCFVIDACSVREWTPRERYPSPL